MNVCSDIPSCGSGRAIGFGFWGGEGYGEFSTSSMSRKGYGYGHTMYDVLCGEGDSNADGLGVGCMCGGGKFDGTGDRNGTLEEYKNAE